jgi:two-component system cell cycle response regulator CtrA
MIDTGPRQYRSFNAREIVIAFARYGIPTDTISRAIVTSSEQVEGVCRKAVESGELLTMPPRSPDDVRGAMATELVHLRELVSEQRDLIREMRAATTSEVADFVAVAGLTVSEATVVATLVKHGKATKQRLFSALFDGRANPNDAPEPKIIDVFVCKIRKKLRPAGIEIGTVWGWGYNLTPENVAKIRALANEHHAVAPSLAPELEDMTI